MEEGIVSMRNWLLTALLSMSMLCVAGTEEHSIEGLERELRDWQHNGLAEREKLLNELSLGGYPAIPPLIRFMCEARTNSDLVSAGKALAAIDPDFRKRPEYVAAMVEFQRVAEAGDVIAQRNLGILHREGISVEKDEAAAQKWYRKAAKQGDGPAQFGLGTIYYRNRDFAEAAKWFRKAAEQGDADAAEALEQLQKKKGKIFG